MLDFVPGYTAVASSARFKTIPKPFDAAASVLAVLYRQQQRRSKSLCRTDMVCQVAAGTQASEA